MNENKNILGCFVSSYASLRESDQKTTDPAEQKGELFRSYIWGETGIGDTLKKLRHEDYGKDLVMILFQFYVNPIPYLLENLKEIENYRRKEKAIGIPIIVDDENFFNKSEEERQKFLKHSIFQRLDVLARVVKQKKLDTNIDLLKSDLLKILA